jgi:hypothetical protein
VIENKHVTRNNSKKNKDEQDEHDFLSKFPFYGSVNILPRNVPMHHAFFFLRLIFIVQTMFMGKTRVKIT